MLAPREDGVLLKTCARTELYWGDGDVPADVARHLFRVAAGLESPLLGEGAILGQIKQSYFEAKKTGKLSPSINKLFQTASYVGHRVRTETGIARGAVSYSQVTVDILCHELPDLGNKVVSIIGVNELTESVLNFLIARGATNILLANRSFDKAEEIAHKYNNVEAFLLLLSKKLLKVSTGIVEKRRKFMSKNHIESEHSNQVPSTDYFTVSQFAQLNPAFSVGCLRNLIFNARMNGFDKVVRRVGGRVLIKLSAFESWVEGQNA